MILLYNPKSNPTGKPILPKAVLALGAMLEGRFDYRIFDGNLLDDSFTTLSTAILESNADILAITAMPGPQITEAAPLSKALKEQFPDLTIIWGGYFPTLHPEPRYPKDSTHPQAAPTLPRGHPYPCRSALLLPPPPRAAHQASGWAGSAPWEGQVSCRGGMEASGRPGCTRA